MVDSFIIHDLGKARIKEEIDIYVLEPTEINRDNIIFALEAMK